MCILSNPPYTVCYYYRPVVPQCEVIEEDTTQLEGTIYFERPSPKY